MAKTKQSKALAKLAPSTDEMRAELTARHNLLIDQANHGDPEATRMLQRLLQLIDDEPPDLLKMFTGFQETVESAFLDLLVPRREGQLFTRALRERQIKRLRGDLLGPHPTPLERLQVDRVVLCWLQAVHAESLYAHCLAGGGHLDVGFHEKRVEQAQRRLQRAILGLATLRRLLIPTVQVNVAKHQVNVASAAVVSASP